MEKILVTGASGFLGANLVKRLHDKGYSVRIIVRKNANIAHVAAYAHEVVYGNIDDAASIESAVAGCDYVVHSASITEQFGVSFEMYERINVHATRLIANACILHNIKKLVYVSTANTIAPGKKDIPGTELNGFSLFKADSGYINSKYLAQQYVLEEVERGKLNAVVVNPTFMIGPNDTKPSSGQIILYAWGKKLLFYPPGGKNFVHINDVCTGIISAITQGKKGDCYLLAGYNLTYKEFFSILHESTGQRAVMIKIPGAILKIAGAFGSFRERFTKKPVRLNKSGAFMLCLDNYYSGKKAERELGVSYTSIEVSVQEACDWFSENGYFNKRK